VLYLRKELAMLREVDICWFACSCLVMKAVRTGKIWLLKLSSMGIVALRFFKGL
jgi:hypothetical protein